MWRILPRRRSKGLRGVGPQGGTRGNTEQWKFPHARLCAGERKLWIAKVVMLATTAMFITGLLVPNTSKGIGLRGTCSIARLVMQMFDGRSWGRYEVT